MNRNKAKDRSEGIPGCVRQLTNFERYLLWSAENSMAIVARIRGDIDEKNLISAINAVRGVHPLMGARVISDDDHMVWFSSDNVPETPFRTSRRASEEQWFDEIRNEFQIPFKPELGSMIRFVLVYSKETSELIAFAEHCICDGISLAMLIRDILTRYSDPSIEMKTIFPPATTDFSPKVDGISDPAPRERTIFDDYNEKWRISPHFFCQEDFLKIHEAWSRRTRHNIALLQLEAEELAKLSSICHKNSVTIGSAVITAFIAAYQEVMGPFTESRRTVQVPFDLRRRVGVDLGDFLGFFVGAFKSPFAYDPGKTLLENARNLNAIIQEHASMLDTSAIDMEGFDPTLVDAFTNYAPFVDLYPEAFRKTENLAEFAGDRGNIAFEIYRNAIRGFPGTIASNIGRIDVPEVYGNLKIDRMFAVAPASNAFPLFLTGMGVCGRLTFSLNFIELEGEDGPYQVEDMIRVRNRALEYLGFPEKANDRAI